MEEKRSIWDPELTRKVLRLRFEHDSLFRKFKQPWREFHKILIKTGFPKIITPKQVMRKWISTYNAYLVAKRSRHTTWLYYDLFEKFFGKSSIFDKYETWSNEWRLMFIYTMTEAKDLDLDYHRTWKTVEKSLRVLRLPRDCYIQDLKGLWRYLKNIFCRKYRIQMKKATTGPDWPLYDAMLDYYRKFEADCLAMLEADPHGESSQMEEENQTPRQYRREIGDEDFEWTQDVTEKFIKIRLQSDSLFREKKLNWNDLLAVLIEEYKFPGTLTGRDLFKKWASIYYEYERAKAMNDKTWVYYNLFELYLGESNFNPIINWHEDWVFNLISARTEFHPVFKSSPNKIVGWREVEKKLRNMGIPLDYSLLEIPDIWMYLWKTFKLRKKLESKGMLNEKWPYYDAMNYYYILDNAAEITGKRQSVVENDDARHGSKVCRSCSNDEGCLNLFEEKDDKGINLAYKLKVVGGVKVERSDSLPTMICLNCATELENAYKFRSKCQVADRRLRKNSSSNGNKEEAGDENDHIANEEYEEVDEDDATDAYNECRDKESDLSVEKAVVKPKRTRTYWKICEVCGKTVRNMYAHKDVHSKGKTYSCDVCGRSFKFRSGMMLHRDIHSATPKKTCEVCGKTFHLLVNYRRHIAYHRNERKYGCSTCGKRFNTSTVLRTHEKSHSELRPYSCDECAKFYKTAQGLDQHNRNVHRRTERLKKE